MICARKFLAVFCAIGLTTSLIACSSSPKPPPPTAAAAPPAGWAEKMHSLSQTLSSLLPMVASRAKFNDPKNAGEVERDTKQLSTLAHSLKAEEKPNSDPSLRVMSGLFAEDIGRAMDALKNGNRDYARHVLKDTTSYCIQCHTQTNNGPDFPRLSLDIKTDDLKPVDRAEFFAATRQFDRSLEAYTQALTGPDLAKSDPFEWENAARTALAITVRVKNDPKQTLALVTQIEKNKARPKSSAQSLKAWKRSIQDWLKEKPLPAGASETDRLKYAEELVKRAQKRQEFPLDHSQDIVYFRAASILHELMQKPPETENRSEFIARSLYWAGMAGEATRDMNFWTLHETYYEQCIRSLPHSNQARMCFGKLKDSVTLGYSGSSGVQIPPDVSKRLENFKTLAASAQSSDKASEATEKVN
jgi:hypothetical protein